MKQFFETYRDEPKLSPLVREITWSNNLLIMAGAKSSEARDDTVVEYALSRSLTPALVSVYTLKLPDKRLLLEKLAEIKDFSDLVDE